MRSSKVITQALISWTFVCFAASSLPNPRIVEHPQDGYVAKDEPASLNCRAEGDPKPKITWYRDGQKVETSPENPFSNRMIFPDGKLFFLSVVHNKKDKSDVGVYYCNATNIHGTAISRNATLSIAVLKTDFRLQPKNISAAIGDSISFTCRPPRGEPEPKIIWKKDSELIISEPSNTRYVVSDNGALNVSQVRKQDAGIFTCIAVNKAGEVESAPAVLRVIEKPSFRRFPGDITTREGKTVEFPCDVVGDKPLQVTWRKENGKIGRISTSSDHTLRIEDVTREDKGIYVCMAKNQVGEAEAVARLNVEYAPEFKVRPVDKTVGIGRSVSLQCVVEGNPTATIYWRKRNHNAKLEKSLIFPYKPDGRYSVRPDGTLQIDNVQPSDAGTFECEALNAVGTDSTSVQLKVKENDSRPPPIIKIGPQNQTLATDETAFLHCDAAGTPTPTVQWYKNGNLLSSDDPRIRQKSTGTLQISGLRVSDSGTYSCKASSETGETMWSCSLAVQVPGDNSALFHRTQDPKYFPGPPSPPEAIEVKDTSIMLSWKPNSNSGGSPVFAYIIEYFSHETTDGWVVVPETIQKDTYTVHNLQPDTSYIFLVRAQNSHGIGEPSPVSKMITTNQLGSVKSFAQHIPQDEIRTRMGGLMVEIIRGEALNSSAIWFEWKPVKEQELIQHYEIVYKRLFSLEDMTAGTTTRKLVAREAILNRKESYTITGLLSHTWYQICVRAFNGDIGSQCSNPIKVRTSESVPTDPPQNIVINKDGKTRVFIQWLPPPVNSRNGDIIGYKIKCFSHDGKHDFSVLINGTGNQYTINNLIEDVTYSVQIAARTSQGLGVWSSPYVVGPEQSSLMEEPWFIGVLIGVVGGTLWLALCIFSIWLCKKRKSKKKMMQNGLYTVPMHKGEDHPCTTFYRNGYLEKESQHMSPEVTNLLDGHKEVEMQDHQNVYNVPQMKSFNYRQDPVAPYATTTLINAGQHMFRPIPQNSGSGDSCCKHECSGSGTDNSHSGGHHHCDHLQSPTSDSGSHTTDENGMLIKKGRRGQGQMVVPKQAMVNWAEFLPPPPEHPPPSEIGSDSPANSLQYAEANQTRAMANRSPMSPMSKISSCSCPVPHSQQPTCAQAWNVPPPAYSDSGCVRCCSPKYCDNGQYSSINRVQSPCSENWGQRTIACTNPSQRVPIDSYCHSRTCHSDHEQNSVHPYRNSDNEQASIHPYVYKPQEAEHQCLSDSGHFSRCQMDGHCMERGCQSSMPGDCHSRMPCRMTDSGHHHMNLAVEGYHRNGDSPGQDYVGESDMESNAPLTEGEECREEHPDDGGSNMSGSMMASWASVTDQSNTDCSSHRSSAASDSDASFLTEADFASAVAKAAELSGLTVVGTTVCDPKTGKPVKRHRRPRPARPVSPYSTDSNFSAVVHKPYPKSQRKRQLMEQGKWQRKDQQTSQPINLNVEEIKSYNKPSFPSPMTSSQHSAKDKI